MGRFFFLSDYEITLRSNAFFPRRRLLARTCRLRERNLPSSFDERLPYFMDRIRSLRLGINYEFSFQPLRYFGWISELASLLFVIFMLALSHSIRPS